MPWKQNPFGYATLRLPNTFSFAGKETEEEFVRVRAGAFAGVSKAIERGQKILAKVTAFVKEESH